MLEEYHILSPANFSGPYIFFPLNTAGKHVRLPPRGSSLGKAAKAATDLANFGGAGLFAKAAVSALLPYFERSKMAR